MRRSLTFITIWVACAMLLAGCSTGTNANPANIPAGTEKDTADAQEEQEDTGEDADKEDEKDTVSAAPETDSYDAEEAGPNDANDTEPEENAFDGGPDWVSLADEFILPTDRMSIEDALEKYSLTLRYGGKYRDYEGDIGDVIPEYKGRDLDGDHKPDVIRREGSHYVFELTRKGTFKTDDYSTAPNEGEVIQFQDLGCRNFDEIEIVHYTIGTGGPTVWDTAVYSWQDGEWRVFPVIDKEGIINSTQLCDLIEKETGKPYEAGSVRVADVHMSFMLIDMGSKDGASQKTDYRTAYLHMNFFPQHLVEGDYECSGLYADMSLVRTWPFDVSGDPVSLTSGLQQKLNVYLSNFSEQNYRMGTWPLDYAHFALEWYKVNDPSKVRIKNDRYRICHADINRVLERFMGTNFIEGDFDDIDEDNPYYGASEYDEEQIWYSEPAADGEMYKYNRFSVATDVCDISSDRDTFLLVKFKIYSLSEEEYDKNGISRKYYSLSADEAGNLEKSGGLYRVSEGFAIVRDVGEDGYWLEYYSVNDDLEGK